MNIFSVSFVAVLVMSFASVAGAADMSKDQKTMMMHKEMSMMHGAMMHCMKEGKAMEDCHSMMMKDCHMAQDKCQKMMTMMSENTDKMMTMMSDEDMKMMMEHPMMGHSMMDKKMGKKMSNK